MTHGVEVIAKMCHEVNKLWCELHGDYSQPPWRDAEPWQQDSTRAGVEFRQRNPQAPASLQHEQWMADKVTNGWVYGETKDADLKTHPLLVPFDQLPPEQQAKDHLFAAVVLALSPETS